MAKHLPDSAVERQNILNNHFALDVIQQQVGFAGALVDGEYKYTISQVAEFYEVEVRTVRRYLSNYSDELKSNGYEILIGKRLEEAKKQLDSDTNVTIKNVRRLGVLNFRAFLNLGMLLVESEKARVLRGLILDIVLDVMTQKAGGSTKYINQRDETYLISLYVGENYRQDFIDALKDCVEMGNYKYAVYTNKIYKSIFKEHAQEYRNILSLTKKENVRDTMYSEVLTTISMYETGLGHAIREKSSAIGRKLKPSEVDSLFKKFEANPAWTPQLEMARMKMASRDYGFRSVIHPELVEYVNPLNSAEFERFLGKKSAELAEQIQQYQDVFKRLKDK